MGDISNPPNRAGSTHLTPLEKEECKMPILLWLLGIPIPLIILIMLLHH
jgi:hypothetical protein